MQKTTKNGKKGANNADLRLFLTFWSIFVNFEQKKNQNEKNICLKNLAQNADFSLFCSQKNELYGQNAHSIAKPLLCQVTAKC